LDLEIEAPVARHPALPHIERRAVFLYVQGRMGAVEQQEAQLLAERLADDDRQAGIVLVGSLRKPQLHGLSFLWRFARASSAVIAASAVSYGPWVRPRLASSSPSARCRSTRVFGVKVI